MKPPICISTLFTHSLTHSLIHLPRVIQLFEITPPIPRGEILLFEPVPPVNAIPPPPRPDPVAVRHRGPVIQRPAADAGARIFHRQERGGGIVPALAVLELGVQRGVVGVAGHGEEFGLGQLFAALGALGALDVALLRFELGGGLGGFIFGALARFGALHGDADDAAAGVAVDGFLPAAGVGFAVLEELLALAGLLTAQLLGDLVGTLEPRVGARFHFRHRHRHRRRRPGGSCCGR